MREKTAEAKTRLSVELFRRLLERAKANCRSVAGEVRAILTAALQEK
jgi:plasmid stability protein